ncbi:hypothetical protein POTOM_036276 [Populus tomentosa]|uniref:Uncharacterized protein n=1 Tax=Populus tomentosa TaxID=118781 RepID=A0A8X8CMY7_POPTO|nr:hypothetical protein POTOM_036276 [Populus tomentosa]
MVQIVNAYVFGCASSTIHFHGGWFASARVVNPRTFKRLSYDDCLVNGGKALKTKACALIAVFFSIALIQHQLVKARVRELTKEVAR